MLQQQPPSPPHQLQLLSIDVGYRHLALVSATATYCVDRARWILTDVGDLECLNIGDMRQHVRVPRSQCTLSHSRHVVDLVAHVMQERRAQFDAADAVLIEAQPPTGLRDVEALLYNAHRSKAHLISPTHVHAVTGLRALDYDGRKTASVERALTLLRAFPAAADAFYALKPRHHDVADAIMFVDVYLAELAPPDDDVARQQRRRLSDAERAYIKAAGGPLAYLDTFRFRGSVGHGHHVKKAGATSRGGHDNDDGNGRVVDADTIPAFASPAAKASAMLRAERRRRRSVDGS